MSGGVGKRRTMELPNFNSDHCLKIVKVAAFVSVGWLFPEFATLLVVGPNNDRCPGWMTHSENGSATSLWLLAGIFTAAPAFWLCYVVRHWDRFIEQAVDDMLSGRPKGFFRIKSDPSHLFLINSNALCLVVMIGWSLFCAFPLWMILTSCTDVPRYFEYLARFTR